MERAKSKIPAATNRPHFCIRISSFQLAHSTLDSFTGHSQRLKLNSSKPTSASTAHKAPLELSLHHVVQQRKRRRLCGKPRCDWRRFSKRWSEYYPCSQGEPQRSSWKCTGNHSRSGHCSYAPVSIVSCLPLPLPLSPLVV
jgi:hypothetical protein